jgi:hypothetical protein
MLKKVFIRNGANELIGSVTKGYSDTSSIVRDERNQILGRTNDRFQTTRDKNGKLLSINSADPGLLLGQKK